MDALLDGLERYLPAPQYGADFGARVFKIARDAQGNRLSYLKITGGALSVREQLSGGEDGRLAGKSERHPYLHRVKNSARLSASRAAWSVR